MNEQEMELEWGFDENVILNLVAYDEGLPKAIDDIHTTGRSSIQVMIGRPQLWSARKLLKDEQRPLGEFHYWILAIPCTVETVANTSWRVSDARLFVDLQPRIAEAGERSVTACHLYPMYEEATKSIEFGVGIGGPKIAVWPLGIEIELKPIQLKPYIKVDIPFPVTQAFGLGTPNPFWSFSTIGKNGLAGTQSVCAVLAAEKRANGIKGRISFEAWGNRRRLFAIDRDSNSAKLPFQIKRRDSQ